MRNTHVPDMTERFPEGERYESDFDMMSFLESSSFDDREYEDDVYEETGNAPCDNSGFCAGSSCKYFYQCQK